MDGFQIKLLRLLSENSRASISYIAKELGASRKKVKETIDRLIDTKIIKRFTIEIAQETEFTFQPVRAVFNVQLVAPKCKYLFADIQKYDEIIGSWSISSSEIDMMLMVEAKDVEAIEKVRNNIALHPLVQTMYTNTVLTTWRDPRSNLRHDGGIGI
jgi:DNA-binding Lrp family transcriptional regulator